MKNKCKLWLKAIGLILAYFGAQEIIALFASFYKDDYFVKNVVLILGYFVTMLMLIYIFKDKFKKDIKDFKDNYKKYIPMIIKYWAVGFTIMFVVNLIIVTVFLHGVAPNEEANRLMLKAYPLFMSLSISIFAPISEEILFRVSFKDVLKKKYIYILFTGITFGAMHMLANTSWIECLYVLSYSALGIAFSALAYDTDNIYSSILAHMMHNTLTLILLLRFL